MQLLNLLILLFEQSLIVGGGIGCSMRPDRCPLVDLAQLIVTLGGLCPRPPHAVVFIVHRHDFLAIFDLAAGSIGLVCLGAGNFGAVNETLRLSVIESRRYLHYWLQTCFILPLRGRIHPAQADHFVRCCLASAFAGWCLEVDAGDDRVRRRGAFD